MTVLCTVIIQSFVCHIDELTKIIFGYRRNLKIKKAEYQNKCKNYAKQKQQKYELRKMTNALTIANRKH